MPRYANNNPDAGSYTARPSKYPQGAFKDKPCRMCGTVFSPCAPSHLTCSEACRQDSYTNSYLKRTYGIDLKTYQAMLAAQDHRCALCGDEGFVMNTDRHRMKLVVDHCHSTGKVRGLLCHNCNRALGLFKDNIETMRRGISYLEGATTIP